MASPVIQALETAALVRSSRKGYFWAFRHPNPDAPPETFRLTRRDGNGWRLILAASKQTKDVLNFNADTPDDQAAVKEALKWLGISGTIENNANGVVLQLANGNAVRSLVAGGEKPKVKK